MQEGKVRPMNALPVGAMIGASGVTYRVWAPQISHATVHIERYGWSHCISLVKNSDGYHEGLDPEGKAGDLYGYRLEENGPILPDPASRGQAESVHGLSMVVGHRNYAWADAEWERPTFRDLVIYELHVGTFTQEGTFRSAIAKLPYLKELGVSAIEMMPLADFPGSRNWGYDGVLIYAPARCYGSPEDLRALVDAAHQQGLAVILDVVYNHFGPDGNYFSTFSPYYFNKRHTTPWGDGFNFDGEYCQPVRDFFRRNPEYWMEEFHIDGFRFDATHEIKDDSPNHILAEITEVIHRRGGYAIAEDDRNSIQIITNEGGLGFDGVWADDFHHTARVGVTAENHSYFADFEGSIEQMVTTLRDGWFYHGQTSKILQRPRGTEANHLPPERFIHCISNHDQVGNRAFGERLHQLIPGHAYRTLSVLLCLTPYTPMLFMGQEWSCSSPFLFFADHNEELGRKITEGRRKEFASNPEFSDPATREKIPDPQSPETFLASKLKWEEVEKGEHASMKKLYQECLQLRNSDSAFRPPERSGWKVEATNWGGATLCFSGTRQEYLLIFDLAGTHVGTLKDPKDWQLLLSSEEKKFGGAGHSAWQNATLPLVFKRPEALLLTRKAPSKTL
jgi:maltooligosyltrehalose trehalohydrolase